MSTQANAYRVLAGPDDFLDSAFNSTAFYANFSNHATSDMPAPSPDILDLARTLQQRIQKMEFTQMTPGECARTYSQQYVSKWGDLVVIEQSEPLSYQSRRTTSIEHYTIENCTAYDDNQDSSITSKSCYGTQTSDSLLIWNASTSSWTPSFEADEIMADTQQGYSTLTSGWYSNTTIPNSGENVSSTLDYSSLPTTFPSYAWQCSSWSLGSCTLPPDLWMPFGSPVLHCWAEKVPESCTLNFNLYLGIIVIACNATKLVCMILTILRHQQPALITIGDAIQSFLVEPDETTINMCLRSVNLMHMFWEWGRTNPNATIQQKIVDEPRLERYRHLSYRFEMGRWAQFASIRRWLTCLSM